MFLKIIMLFISKLFFWKFTYSLIETEYLAKY